MTLPIVHQDVVVGTVGITGTPDQVLRFGQVVKRQTEILLEEAVLVRTRMTRERVLESLLRDLLTYDPEQPADVATRARDFGLDLGVARRAMVFDLEADMESALTLTSPLRVLREAFRHPQDISGALSPSRCVVLEHTGAAGRGIEPRDPVRALRRPGAQRRRRLRRRDRGTGGGRGGDQPLVRRGTDGAAARAGRRPVSPYNIEALRGHEMVLAVPPRARQRIAAAPWGRCARTGTGRPCATTIMEFVEHGFALVAAASALQIHRNTLVYRLGRIASAPESPRTTGAAGWRSTWPV